MRAICCLTKNPSGLKIFCLILKRYDLKTAQRCICSAVPVQRNLERLHHSAHSATHALRHRGGFVFFLLGDDTICREKHRRNGRGVLQCGLGYLRRIDDACLDEVFIGIRFGVVAKAVRSFFSFISTSVAAPTLITATPPASIAKRSWSFSRS